jgi:hypothetical protein
MQWGHNPIAGAATCQHPKSSIPAACFLTEISDCTVLAAFITEQQVIANGRAPLHLSDRVRQG